MTRLARVDFACAFAIGDEAVTPTQGTASWTVDGYLLVDAYLARDGLLTYSDGKESWMEMRPRSELEKAASSWAYTPVTDDHPIEMVSPSNWSSVARGVCTSCPVIEDVDGVAYLRSRLLITDADLLDKIKDGLRELSIGFTSAVLPTDIGMDYAAVQTDLTGNHVAVVDRGRAGPNVRLLMDSEGAATSGHTMAIANKKPEKKGDAEGAPVDSVEIIGPDGNPLTVPTWIAAALEELAGLKMAPTEPAPIEPAAPVDAAYEPPAPEKKSEEELLSKDAVAVIVKRRARLERLAATVGVADSEFDSADDDSLAKRFISAKMPKARVDGLSALQLDALVDAAATIEAPQPPKDFPSPQERTTKDSANSVSPGMIDQLKRQGYL